MAVEAWQWARSASHSSRSDHLLPLIVSLIASFGALAFGALAWREAHKFSRQRELEAVALNALMEQLAHEMHTRIPFDLPQRRIAVRQRVIKACHDSNRVRPADGELEKVLPWLAS